MYHEDFSAEDTLPVSWCLKTMNLKNYTMIFDTFWDFIDFFGLHETFFRLMGIMK